MWVWSNIVCFLYYIDIVFKVNVTSIGLQNPKHKLLVNEQLVLDTENASMTHPCDAELVTGWHNLGQPTVPGSVLRNNHSVFYLPAIPDTDLLVDELHMHSTINLHHQVAVNSRTCPTVDMNQSWINTTYLNQTTFWRRHHNHILICWLFLLQLYLSGFSFIDKLHHQVVPFTLVFCVQLKP